MAGATLHSRVKATGEMSKEVAWLLAAVKQEFVEV